MLLLLILILIIIIIIIIIRPKWEENEALADEI